MVAFSSAAWAGYVSDGFEGAPGSLNGQGQWASSDSSVIRSNAPVGSARSGSGVAIIPVLQGLTNLVECPAISNRVWNDFYTVARPFYSDVNTAPDVDPSATGQFFVQSNGQWALVYRLNGVTLVTNCFGANLYGGSIVHANTGTNWTHVSVLNDYSNKTWSFFIQGLPVATNLGFINTSVSNFTAFSVESLGGDQSNRTLLDDVLITNTVPSSLTNAHDPDGIRDAWQLMYYGELNPAVMPGATNDGWTILQKSLVGFDPYESNSVTPLVYVFGTNSDGTVGGIEALARTNTPSIRLSLNIVNPNQTYRVLKTTDPNGTWNQVGSFHSGPNGDTNWFEDATALSGARGYYKLVTEVSGILQTNETVYAWYKQQRTNTTSGASYWVGIPVNLGTNNTLDSALGAQLGQGLKAGGSVFGADTLKIFYPSEKLFYWGTDGKWHLAPFDPTPATDAIQVGHAVVITRNGGAGQDGYANAVLMGQKLTNAGAVVPVVPGWNVLSWPYDSSSRVWGLSQAMGGRPDANPYAADRIWLISAGQYRHIWLQSNGWYNVITGGAISNTPYGVIQVGEGFFYTNAAGSNWTWRP
jgi:hypothetical protein